MLIYHSSHNEKLTSDDPTDTSLFPTLFYAMIAGTATGAMSNSAAEQRGMVRGAVVYDLYKRFIRDGYRSVNGSDWSKGKHEDSCEEARREQLVYRALC
jgi:hypothetical protein